MQSSFWISSIFCKPLYVSANLRLRLTVICLVPPLFWLPPRYVLSSYLLLWDAATITWFYKPVPIYECPIHCCLVLIWWFCTDSWSSVSVHSFSWRRLFLLLEHAAALVSVTVSFLAKLKLLNIYVWGVIRSVVKVVALGDSGMVWRPFASIYLLTPLL